MASCCCRRFSVRLLFRGVKNFQTTASHATRTTRSIHGKLVAASAVVGYLAYKAVATSSTASQSASVAFAAKVRLDIGFD